MDITARRHGIGKDKEFDAGAPLLAQPLQQQLILVVQHALQALSAHVAIGMPVDRVAHRHVVGRNRLGNCARRSADTEKPPRDFLPGPDLGKDAVFARIEIHLERLLVGIRGFALCRREFGRTPRFLGSTGGRSPCVVRGGGKRIRFYIRIHDIWFVRPELRYRCKLERWFHR